MSPKLTPAAVTRISTSPGPGAGTGASVIRRRSCGPFSDVCCRARMAAGMLIGTSVLSWIFCSKRKIFIERSRKDWHAVPVSVKVNLIERQRKARGVPMATRGRPRAFDPDEALRKALAVFWERGYEGTSMNDLVEAMGIASASIYAAFGSKAELFRRTMGLYGATRGEPPRRALREQPTARGAIEAMLRATADEITRPDDPHYCMLILAAPTGAVENHEVREFLAGGRRAMLAEIRGRLVRGTVDGDLAASPASLDAIARYYTTVVQGLSIQARDGASREELETVIGCAMAAWDTLAPGPAGA